MIKMLLGIVMCLFGFSGMIRGRLPFIKKYHGIKNIKLHSRIEGGAVSVVGMALIFQTFIPFGSVGLAIFILSICIVSLILEILLKII